MPATKRRHKPVGTGAGIAGQLREIIAGRGLTAYGLAQSAGVAPSVVSRFLTRERGLTLETFDAIAGALGLRLVETGRGRGRPAKASRPVPALVEVPPDLDELEASRPEPTGHDEAPSPGPEPDHPGPLVTTSDHPWSLADGPGYDEPSKSVADDEDEQPWQA